MPCRAVTFIMFSRNFISGPLGVLPGIFSPKIAIARCCCPYYRGSLHISSCSYSLSHSMPSHSRCFVVFLTPSSERLSALLNRHSNRSQFGCCSRRTLYPGYRCWNFNHLKSHLAWCSCTALVYRQRDQLSSITTACITFGMPRTGNLAWAQAFNQIVGLNFRFWPRRFTRSFYHYLFLPSE